MIELKYASQTDVGKHRGSNEDGMLATGLVFAVADGMGGHHAGEVASQLALEVVQKSFNKIPADNLKEYIRQVIKEANGKIYKKAQNDPKLAGMGTTLTLAIPAGDKVYIGHVGDSRCYLLKNSRLVQVTKDHSLVENMLKEGKITSKQAASHPMKNIITRALGAEPDVEVDLAVEKLGPGNKMLLASDGLTAMLTDGQINSILDQGLSPKKTCHKLVTEANRKGGLDNITVVVGEVKEAK